MKTKLVLLYATIGLNLLLSVWLISTLWPQKGRERVHSSVNTRDSGYRKEKSNNIYFSRIGKTGSTTMKSIILRYTWNNNLRFATYSKNTQSYLARDNDTLMTGLYPPFIKGESLKYNVIAEHSAYNQKALDAVLKSPTAHVTMLRHPLKWLTSFLMHRKYNSHWDMGLDDENIVESFINKFEDPSWRKSQKRYLEEIHFYFSLFLEGTRK